MRKKIFFILIIILSCLFFEVKNVQGVDEVDTDQASQREDNTEESEPSDDESLGEKIAAGIIDIGATGLDYVTYFIPGLGGLRIGTEVAKGIYIVTGNSVDGLKDNKTYQDAGKLIDVADLATHPKDLETKIINDVYNDGENKTLGQSAVSFVEDVAEDPAGTIQDLVTKPVDFVNETLEKIGEWLIDFFFTGLGDIAQMITNGLQTDALKKNVAFWRITYSPKEIEKNSDINKYINLNSKNDSNEQNKPKYHKKLVNYNSKGLTKDTAIPFVVVDVHSLVTEKVAWTDINFLKVDEDIHNNETTLWNIVRNLAVVIIRSVIYLSAAVLITALIYYGIVVVSNVYSPTERAKRQNGINRFIKSVLMLVGSVLAMSLIISFSRMTIRYMLNDTNSNEFPIRVEEVKREGNKETTFRTFSTNVTGFCRYKAQITGDLAQKAVYAFIYMILAFLNVVWGLLMIGRFFAIIVLSVQGVLLSVIHIVRREDINRQFLEWGLWYGAVAICPIILAVFQKILLEVAFK